MKKGLTATIYIFPKEKTPPKIAVDVTNKSEHEVDGNELARIIRQALTEKSTEINRTLQWRKLGDDRRSAQ